MSLFSLFLHIICLFLLPLSLVFILSPHTSFLSPPHPQSLNTSTAGRWLNETVLTPSYIVQQDAGHWVQQSEMQYWDLLPPHSGHRKNSRGNPVHPLHFNRNEISAVLQDGRGKAGHHSRVNEWVSWNLPVRIWTCRWYRYWSRKINLMFRPLSYPLIPII